MQKISAPHLTFVKRVLPFLALTAVSASTYWSHRDQQYSLAIAVGCFVVGSLVMWLILRRGFWRLADTVEDHGDKLVITRWRTRIEVPIADVKQLRRERTLNGSTVVTIFLSVPSALGSEIVFLAPGRRTMRDIDEKLDSLARRVPQSQRTP